MAGVGLFVINLTKEELEHIKKKKYLLKKYFFNSYSFIFIVYAYTFYATIFYLKMLQDPIRNEDTSGKNYKQC